MISYLIRQWRANKHAKRGRMAARDGDWEKARSAADRVVELQPENLEALSLLGLASFRLKQYNKAIECFSELLVLKPGDVVARRNMAMAFAKLSQWPKALDLFQQLAAERPDDKEITDALAFVAAKSGDTEAIPRHPESSIKQAIADRKWTRVIAIAQKRLKESPDDVDAMLHQGLAYYKSAQVGNARKWFEKAVEATRNGDYAFRHAPALNNLAMACMKLHDWGAAIEALLTLQTMIRHGVPGTQNLKQDNVLVNLVVCYREKRQPRMAKEAYSELMGVAPDVAAKTDPGDLDIPLGAALKSSAPLGTKLELSGTPVFGTPTSASSNNQNSCPTCGNKVGPDQNFCGSCGAPLAEPVTQAT